MDTVEITVTDDELRIDEHHGELVDELAERIEALIDPERRETITRGRRHHHNDSTRLELLFHTAEEDCVELTIDIDTIEVELLAYVEMLVPWDTREDSDARFRDDQRRERRERVDWAITVDAERNVNALRERVTKRRAEIDATTRAGLTYDLHAVLAAIRAAGQDTATVDLEAEGMKTLRDQCYDLGWWEQPADEAGVFANRRDGHNYWEATALDARSTVEDEWFDWVRVTEFDLAPWRLSGPDH